MAPRRFPQDAIRHAAPGPEGAERSFDDAVSHTEKLVEAWLDARKLEEDVPQVDRIRIICVPQIADYPKSLMTKAQSVGTMAASAAFLSQHSSIASGPHQVKGFARTDIVFLAGSTSLSLR
jgi:hypothetical protein